MERKLEKIPETRDQAIVRLAIQGRSRGVQLFYYPQTKEWYATSHRNPGELHRVTLLSCDCPGFFSHGRCMHNSLLLAELGELPGDPAPEPTPIRPLTTTFDRCAACTCGHERSMHSDYVNGCWFAGCECNTFRLAATAPLSATIAVETPQCAELQSYLNARIEVVRLSRAPKSTADWHRLQNAQGRLAELTTPAPAIAS